jgi:anti-sigma-K factor RskA
MTIERETPHEWGDDEVTRVLRDLYESPAPNASYWDTLETRIMARIAGAGEAPEWWGVFHGWVRVGLAAAVLAAVLTGAALLREREAQERLAYETVMESASVIPVAGPTIARGPGRSRDATLRSIISP